MTNRAQDWLRQALRDLEQAEGLCRYFGCPAIYDLAEWQHLLEVIEMAGGVLLDAYTGRAG